MTAEQMFHLAEKRGIRLEYWNDRGMSITPVSMPPKFRRVLMAHEKKLIPFLRERARPWLHLCKGILLGEFDASPIDTVARIRSMLEQHCGHPLVDSALLRLMQKQQPTRTLDGEHEY